MGEKGTLLEDHANAAVFWRKTLAADINRLAADGDDAFIRLFKPGNQPERSGFAAAAGAQQRHYLALGDGQF
jgi:hypothetical protein